MLNISHIRTLRWGVGMSALGILLMILDLRYGSIFGRMLYSFDSLGYLGLFIFFMGFALIVAGTLLLGKPEPPPPTYAAGYPPQYPYGYPPQNQAGGPPYPEDPGSQDRQQRPPAP